VLAHDFCDGVNVVSLMLAHRHNTARALAMLVLDAAARLIGSTGFGVVLLSGPARLAH
jgi:hypothetical protein